MGDKILKLGDPVFILLKPSQILGLGHKQEGSLLLQCDVRDDDEFQIMLKEGFIRKFGVVTGMNATQTTYQYEPIGIFERVFQKVGLAEFMAAHSNDKSFLKKLAGAILADPPAEEEGKAKK